MGVTDVDVNREIAKAERVADHVVDADQHVNPPPTMWADYLSPAFRAQAPRLESDDEFDYVVFDTPPVIILDDTLCLAPKLDATIFVVRFNNSSVRSSRRALELLARRQANVIGLVCNGVTLSETEYNYNYNYRRYYGGKYAEARAQNGV